jgi:hypothetical protein
MLDRAALSAVMVPVRRIGFLVMLTYVGMPAGFRQARSAQRVVLVSDVSGKFKIGFDGVREKQEKNRRLSPARNSRSRGGTGRAISSRARRVRPLPARGGERDMRYCDCES